MAELRAVVFMAGGRWAASCPRPFCLNAEGFGPQQDGITGGLTGDMFYCREAYGGCGMRCPADWPSNVSEIEALVMPRPVPATRNWLPGEALHDLLAENVAHGIVPTSALEGGPTRKLLEIVGDQVTVGQLGFAEHREIAR